MVCVMNKIMNEILIKSGPFPWECKFQECRKLHVIIMTRGPMYVIHAGNSGLEALAT